MTVGWEVKKCEQGGKNEKENRNTCYSLFDRIVRYWSFLSELGKEGGEGEPRGPSTGPDYSQNQDGRDL